jgi:hypothetical protein
MTIRIGAGICIERFSYNQNTGIHSIDKRSSPFRECYVARMNGELAHESWLFFDVMLPVQFGFEGDVPVIGECVTYPEFSRK